jgi:serine beta-lactamase-like protein LACTB
MLNMYRKVGYAFGAAVGSFAVICGFKNQYLKDSRDELRFIQAASAQEVLKETENNERNIIPVSLSVTTAGYENENLSIQNAIVKARDLAYRKKDEVGAPGLVIGVSINGKTVWTEGEYSIAAIHCVLFSYME